MDYCLLNESNGHNFHVQHAKNPQKRGVSKTRNAIKLLEYIGYPKDIINKSYRRSEKLEGFI